MSASGYFEKMLDGDFREKNSEVICLGDVITFEALDKLVKFLYNGELVATKEVSVEDLLCAADYLQMESANEALVGPISKAIDKTSALRFWNLRSMIKDTGTIAQLRAFILGHFKEIVYDRSFLAIDYETISWIVESDELQVDAEVDVFRAIRMWINHEHTEREKHFLSLLARVRFDKNMPLEFIMNDMLRECKCTETMDVVISHLAKRVNYTGDLDLVVKARTGASA